ncbi:hypothetical protein [Halomontanus rarus]|uniref:hypothetical protein n=1 Tax=Halomontanus rarus TaxID=3034020 RepID=UPI001A995F67
MTDDADGTHEGDRTNRTDETRRGGPERDADRGPPASETPASIHVVTEYPGETLDEKLERVFETLPGEGQGRQSGHRIVIPAPDPDDPAAIAEGPDWRVESPIVVDDLLGKVVFELGWTRLRATAPIEHFLVVGPDDKTAHVTLEGGMFYANGNVERSFVDIRGVGHMHVDRTYLESLEGRNSVPAGIRLRDYHGTSEVTITDTEVTGCRDGFLAEHGVDDVPYGAAFDLDIYNWRGGGGEHSIRIDGGVGITLHSIQVGGHPIQSVSDSIVKLENAVTPVRNVSISNVRERHNAMAYDSGVAAVDVTDGEGDRHDGLYVRNVDCHHAARSTDLEYVAAFDQENLRPPPRVGDSADGSTRRFDGDGGVQRHETTGTHAFYAGGSAEPTAVVDERDVHLSQAGGGIVLTTPDGDRRFRLRVDDDGTPITEELER